MESWVVDLGNPTNTAFALKLTSTLLKELENNQNATIKFNKENSAVCDSICIHNFLDKFIADKISLITIFFFHLTLIRY